MKKIFYNAVLGLLMMGFLSCDSEKETHITITNESDVERAEVVSIKYDDFVAGFGEDTVFRLVDKATGQELPYQFEKHGGSAIGHVLVWLELAANERIDIAVVKEAPAPVEPRTYARYVPERKDDFAWENDKVAFRMYGKALEDFPQEIAYGVDVWAKRTPKLVVDEWYRSGDYHTDHGEGLDYYSVGLTLGAGDIAPFAEGKVVYPKNYRQHEVLDNGPLRSTFKLIYEPWLVNGKEVKAEKIISIDAGSQLNKVQAIFHFEDGNTLDVVAGIVLRGDEGSIMDEKEKGFAAYWEPVHGDDGTLGIAVLSEEPLQDVFRDESQLLALFKAKNGEAVTYYNGAAWDKAGEITTGAAWQNYLEDDLLKRKNPLTVTIK